jgi:tetratricopeptide (TPR) repeat protein
LAYFYASLAVSKQARRYWFILALLCYVPAVMAKPMAITLPAVLLLLDGWPLRRIGKISWKWLLLEKLPFALIASVSIILTLLAQQNAMPQLEVLSVEARILNAFNSAILYLAKFLLPLTFSPYYTYPAERSLAENPWLLLPVVGFLSITIVAWHLWKKQQYHWLAAWLFYLITVSPVIGIIQVGFQSSADRYAYVPTLPAYLLAGVGITALWQTAWRWRHWIGLAVAAAMLGLILQTRQLLVIWQNDWTFWNYAYVYDPKNPMAHCGLATVSLQARDYRTALHYFHSGLQHGLLPICYLGLGATQLAMGNEEDARLVFEDIAQNHFALPPNILSDVYLRLARIYLGRGDAERATAMQRKALELSPGSENTQR